MEFLNGSGELNGTEKPNQNWNRGYWKSRHINMQTEI